MARKSMHRDAVGNLNGRHCHCRTVVRLHGEAGLVDVIFG